MTLLASSGTEEGIKSLIRKFYCMERDAAINIQEDGAIKRLDGFQFPNVVVKKKKGRYRFEGVETKAK